MACQEGFGDAPLQEFPAAGSDSAETERWCAQIDGKGGQQQAGKILPRSWETQGQICPQCFMLKQLSDPKCRGLESDREVRLSEKGVRVAL